MQACNAMLDHKSIMSATYTLTIIVSVIGVLFIYNVMTFKVHYPKVQIIGNTYCDNTNQPQPIQLYNCTNITTIVTNTVNVQVPVNVPVPLLSAYPIRHTVSYPPDYPVSTKCNYNHKHTINAFKSDEALISSTSFDTINKCISTTRQGYKANPLQHATRTDSCLLTRKVYIQIIFNDEIPLLQIHIGELYHVVDYFIVVESDLSLIGVKKDLVYQQYAHLFNQWKDKIIYVHCDLRAVYGANTNKEDLNRGWPREYFARACGTLGLGAASDHDLVVVVDTDEISKPSAISGIKMCSASSYWDSTADGGTGGMIRLCGRRYISNWKWYDKDYPMGCAPVIASVATVRNRQFSVRGNGGALQDGHWHCSWCFFGDPAIMYSKLEKWSEQAETAATINDRTDMIQLQTNCPTSKIRGYRCILNNEYDTSIPEIIKVNRYRFYPNFIPDFVINPNDPEYHQLSNTTHFWKHQPLINPNETMLVPSFDPIPLIAVVY